MGPGRPGIHPHSSPDRRLVPFVFPLTIISSFLCLLLFGVMTVINRNIHPISET